MLNSLKMKARRGRGEDGRIQWFVWAVWLAEEDAVSAASWEEAYWLCIAKKPT